MPHSSAFCAEEWEAITSFSDQLNSSMAAGKWLDSLHDSIITAGNGGIEPGFGSERIWQSAAFLATRAAKASSAMYLLPALPVRREAAGLGGRARSSPSRAVYPRSPPAG